MARRSTWLLGALVGWVGAVGCGDGGPETGPSFAFVRGVVTATDGAPVGAAQVVLEVRRVGESVPIGREPTATDGTGRYEVLLAIFLPPFDGLLDVLVTPPDTTVLRPGVARDRPIRFSLPEERDTLRVNVVLEPA